MSRQVKTFGQSAIREHRCLSVRNEYPLPAYQTLSGIVDAKFKAALLRGPALQCVGPTASEITNCRPCADGLPEL